MKKLMSILMVLTLSVALFSVPTLAIEYSEAQICEHLGMLKGDGYGVTPTFLNKETTRLQAAIMYLRLIGLEEQALAYSGNKTFEDANTVTWAAGRNVMAYLKNHPELGWIGYVNGDFDPFAAIDARAYYKVMLELLGYTYNKDYTWNEVFDFAANFGLGEYKLVTPFTNNDVAKVTVETLRIKDIDGQILVERLVGEGIIEMEEAIQVGLVVVPINDLYALEFVSSDKNNIIPSDGISNVTISVFLIDKETKERIEVDGTIRFYLTEGTLLRTDVNMFGGQATTQIIAPILNDEVVVYLTATILDTQSVVNYGGVTDKFKITYSPDEIVDMTNMNTVNVLSVGAGQGDRFFVTYSGSISSVAYKQALVDKIVGINTWEQLVIAGTNGGMFINGQPIYILDILQKSSNILEFILNTDNPGSIAPTTNIIKSGWVPTSVNAYFQDNATHKLSLPAEVSGIVYSTGELTFIMTDTSKLFTYGAQALDATHIEVRFSESLAEDGVETKARGSSGVTGSTVFVSGMQGHNQNILINGRQVYLINDTKGASVGERAFADSHNLILIKELYVGKYDVLTKVDTRNMLYIVLDEASALLNRTHQIQISNLKDWAGMTDINNSSTTQTIDISY